MFYLILPISLRVFRGGGVSFDIFIGFGALAPLLTAICTSHILYLYWFQLLAPRLIAARPLSLAPPRNLLDLNSFQNWHKIDALKNSLLLRRAFGPFTRGSSLNGSQFNISNFSDMCLFWDGSSDWLFKTHTWEEKQI